MRNTERDSTLWQIVLTRFPKWEKERTCKMERTMRDAARESYYNRLVNERKAAQELLVSVGEAKADH